METVKEGLGFSRSSLFLINKEKKTLECKFICGFTPQQEDIARSKPFDLNKHDCIETKVALTGNTILVRDLDSDPSLTQTDIRISMNMDRGCTLYVPLKLKGDIIGILGVDRKKGDEKIKKEEIESLSIFANFASIFIENSHLYEALLAEKKFPGLSRTRKDIKNSEDFNKPAYNVTKFIGKSKEIHQTLAMIKKVAHIDATVLIEGESGTGKELVARAIHFNSIRRAKPFVEINCAAVPYTLLESELFGYEEGAFTDAKKTKKGLIEQASGGSLFLDEIGDMESGMQAKILKVVEEKHFRRLGGQNPIYADVRIICATNLKLREAVNNKKFREDLFYRLNILRIHLRPLRERNEDIMPLAEYFIDEFNKSFNKSVKGISKKALELLINYSWPGNIRELRNMIQGIMIMSNPQYIERRHLPPEIFEVHDHHPMKIIPQVDCNIPTNGIDMKEFTNDIKAKLITNALRKAGGSKSKAAKLLNVDRFYLRNMINKLKISTDSSSH
jgi:transcriptional regulator with PAS, ATPase and Fis domain